MHGKGRDTDFMHLLFKRKIATVFLKIESVKIPGKQITSEAGGGGERGMCATRNFPLSTAKLLGVYLETGICS